MEISNFYGPIHVQSHYSTSVGDSFKISTATPAKYTTDSLSNFPLILMLDANAYLEPVVAALKLGMLTQGYPQAIIVGVGYNGFWAMDSLRNRDYTYPLAPAADSFKLSGGGLKFKTFIDEELLPNLKNKYRIDATKVVLVGHSLAGYFVLYYFMEAAKKREINITNFVAASPSLWYSKGYLFDQEKLLHQALANTQFKLFVSIGSLERDPETGEDDFQRLKSLFNKRRDTVVKSKFIELGNFDHMEAAIPGFMKGLSFVLTED